MDLTAITPTPQSLRALSHPVRLRMLGLLRIDGPATATALATRLGLNSGATSYHLRQLAQHGFIVDDEERGTGRERWWKAAHNATFTPPEVDDDATRDTLDAYAQAVVTVYTEQLQRAMEERALLPQEWRDASTFSDLTFTLTPRHAKALVEAVYEALKDTEEDEDEDDAATFVLQLNAYPMPGRVAEAGDR